MMMAVKEYKPTTTNKSLFRSNVGTVKLRAVLWIRIRTFWGLPDPDKPLFCTDPDPSINKGKKGTD
jgi:hypothetical protein